MGRKNTKREPYKVDLKQFRALVESGEFKPKEVQKKLNISHSTFYRTLAKLKLKKSVVQFYKDHQADIKAGLQMISDEAKQELILDFLQQDKSEIKDDTKRAILHTLAVQSKIDHEVEQNLRGKGVQSGIQVVVFNRADTVNMNIDNRMENKETISLQSVKLIPGEKEVTVNP